MTDIERLIEFASNLTDEQAAEVLRLINEAVVKPDELAEDRGAGVYPADLLVG